MTKEMLRYAFFILLSLLINIGAIYVLIQFDDPSPISKTTQTHVKLISTPSKQVPKKVKTVKEQPSPHVVKTPAPPKIIKEKSVPKKEVPKTTVQNKKKTQPKDQKKIKKDPEKQTDKIANNIAFIQKPVRTEQKHFPLSEEDNHKEIVKKTTPLKTPVTVPMMPPSINYNKLFALHEVDIKPQILHSVKPLYPIFAKRRQIEGELLLQFVVDEKGDVKDIQILSAEPADVFDENTLKAVQKYRFSPGRVAGIPVQTKVELPFRFTLTQ